VERAIKKGTGEGNDTIYYEVTYEGYGPGGAAILVNALTDNKNRTVAEVRSTLTKRGGSMGEAGCVAWLFEKKGVINVKKEVISEEEIMELAIEAGAEDVEINDDGYEIISEPENYYSIKDVLETKNIEIEYSEITMRPKTTVELKGEDAKKAVALVEALEDLDDVQEVYTNFDVYESELE
jgi:YebC/PmpR family DNA-binding regulatory protein